MQKLRFLGVALVMAVAAPANAASIFFDFDQANSSISVTENGRLCFPSTGCKLSATLENLADVSIDEGQSYTFDFAKLLVSRGVGGDADAQITATLAFTSPTAGPAGTPGTVSYFTLGGLVSGGVLNWAINSQQFTSPEGVFTVQFLDGADVFLGSQAYAPVRITVDSVSSAVPEPATWAMMIGGFGLVGGAMRRRASQVRTVLA